MHKPVPFTCSDVSYRKNFNLLTLTPTQISVEQRKARHPTKHLGNTGKMIGETDDQSGEKASMGRRKKSKLNLLSFQGCQDYKCRFPFIRSDRFNQRKRDPVWPVQPAQAGSELARLGLDRISQKSSKFPSKFLNFAKICSKFLANFLNFSTI